MAAKVDPRKARDARARKLLFVMVPVFIALVAWQGPKVLKQVRGEAPAAASQSQPSESSSGTEVPAPSTDPATTPSDASGADSSGDALAVPVANQNALPDTDLQPAPDEGQLIVFSRFEARDPFVQLVDDGDTGGTDASADTSETGGGTTSAQTTAPPSSSVGTPGGSPSVVPSDPGSTTASEAKISINGRVTVLIVGDEFPESDPAFKVVSISGDSVEIGLVSGSFAGGQETLTLKVGEPVTLISQPDGARFTLNLVSTS